MIHHSSTSARVIVFGAIVGCGALMTMSVASGWADPPLASRWPVNEIVIDGSVGDWPGLERIGDGPGVAAQNDGTTMYLAVASNDPVVRQQLATGLIVWFDGSARKAQTFGVRLEGLARRPLPGATPDATASSVLDRNLTLNTLDAFDVLGPAKNQRRLVDNPAAAGVALASGVENGMMVYELKLPLDRGSATPYAIGAKPGATVAVGIETPADPNAPRSRNRLDDPGNTNPWVVNPYGGYFNPPPPPGGGTRPKEVVIKPIKLIWTSVRLAAGPAR